MIVIRDLDKTFNRGKANAIHVINDISLDLPASGMVAIFGRSGCGKTTLLNVIGGLDRVQSGSVEIDGEKMTHRSDALRNRAVGYIFQNYCLNREESCYDNVADALRLLGVNDRATLDAQVHAALSAVGMDRFASRLPDTLSGGQQQRIAIARAIVKNPPVILADEPTGNLDEANTLHIMRLLKAISRDRLVLLVTHEENLVSAFSDRVIELSDGRVISDRENTPTEGCVSRDKNAVYLGELEHRTLPPDDAGVTVDLFGAPAPGVKLRLVHAEDGRIYLKVDAGNVQILDENSEVKLNDGVAPAPKKEGEEDDAFPDLSAIRSVKGSRFGRLFGFAGAWKSGVRFNLGKKKRGRKLLRNALILFAAVIVFMTASLGVFVRELADVDKTYHHRMIYAYAGDERCFDRLNAMGEEQGVTYKQISTFTGDTLFTFKIGSFETFRGSTYSTDATKLTANGAALLRSYAMPLKLIAGTKTDLDEHDVLISEAFASALLKSSQLGVIKTPEDLIGVCREDGYRIAGVVEGNEREIYFPASALLPSDSWRGTSLYTPEMLRVGDKYSPADGHTIVILEDYNESFAARYPRAGGTVLINGKDFTVDRVIMNYEESYETWCAVQGFALPNLSNPTFAQYSEYVSHYSDYLSEKIAFFGYSDPILFLWASSPSSDIYYFTGLRNKTVSSALQMLYYRVQWLNAHPGETSDPSVGQVNEWVEEQKKKYNDPYQARLEEIKEIDLVDYYGYGWKGGFSTNGNGYLFNESEAEKALSRCGATTGMEWVNSYMDYTYAGDVVIGTPTVGSAYLMLRSNDLAKTKAYLETYLGPVYEILYDEPESDVNRDWRPAVLTPSDFRQEALSDQKAGIISNAIELAVFLGVMSLCMYLMMRASTMGRIREIGIYRAIGVSKGNLIFRFFVESLAVTSLTVLIGYLFSSVLISAWLVKAPLIGDFFYYPAWMALATLALLVCVSSLCGTLPVLRLLKKTPSEILSKYDI